MEIRYIYMYHHFSDHQTMKIYNTWWWSVHFIWLPCLVEISTTSNNIFTPKSPWNYVYRYITKIFSRNCNGYKHTFEKSQTYPYVNELRKCLIVFFFKVFLMNAFSLEMFTGKSPSKCFFKSTISDFLTF